MQLELRPVMGRVLLLDQNQSTEGFGTDVVNFDESG